MLITEAHHRHLESIDPVLWDPVISSPRKRMLALALQRLATNEYGSTSHEEAVAGQKGSRAEKTPCQDPSLTKWALLGLRNPSQTPKRAMLDALRLEAIRKHFAHPSGQVSCACIVSVQLRRYPYSVCRAWTSESLLRSGKG